MGMTKQDLTSDYGSCHILPVDGDMITTDSGYR
jgi:hypothetical protein